MNTVVRLLRSKDESVALRASTAVLDRTGHGKRAQLNVTGHVEVTAAQIVTVVVGTLQDIGVPVDDEHVRQTVAQHLRVASRQHLAPVPSDG